MGIIATIMLCIKFSNENNLFIVFINLFSSYYNSKVTMQPNETVEKLLVLKTSKKNLPPQAQKPPKYCQNVVWNAKNKVLFGVSLPLFKNYF
jgi:hypothetical protein